MKEQFAQYYRANQSEPNLTYRNIADSIIIIIYECVH